jgi:hypothetical protein
MRTFVFQDLGSTEFFYWQIVAEILKFIWVRRENKKIRTNQQNTNIVTLIFAKSVFFTFLRRAKLLEVVQEKNEDRGDY